MSASAQSSSADRNLLFGILALQMDFISRDALIEAMNAWVLDKTKSLGQILLDQEHLDADCLQVLEAVVVKHLEAHSGDAQQSIASLSIMPAVQRELREICDNDVQASLANARLEEVTGDHGTVDFRAPRETTDGQRYRILRPHARGGLGEVFVAEDAELHREVALKEMRQEIAHDDYSRGRFLLEAEITGGLEHPGIVPVYGLGLYDDGRPFYAMRLVRGDDLKHAIKRFHQSEKSNVTSGARNVAFRDLLGRFIDVCNAIAYAHSRGILHRDLKPGNIMLGKYGETMIVDWGLAKPVDRQETLTDLEEVTLRPSSAESSMAATQMGSAIGTPAFMSPEQAAGRLDQLGPASDIYSLGATLYVLLTGETAFRGEPATILTKVERGEFDPPRQVKGDVPAPLEAVCLKAMASKPEERYASALELAEDIEHWLADEPVNAWPEPPAVKMGRWVRKHKPLVASAAAAFLVGLIAIAAGLIWYQHDRARRATELARTQQGIRDALDQAQKLRSQLHDDLRQPGGVFRLLDDPSRWEGQIKQAQAVLERARTLQKGIGEKTDTLTNQILSLAALLKIDEADRKLALRLERVLFDRFELTDGEYDYARISGVYKRVFQDTNFKILAGTEKSVAARIRKSPIKEQIVASLDGWARATIDSGEKDLRKRLLKVARLADPDPWKDQVRHTGTWNDAKELKKLMKSAPVDRLSPQMLVLFGQLLHDNKVGAEEWLRDAQARHRSNFWLNIAIAWTLRESAKLKEAAGFYQAALALRPNNSIVFHHLGYTYFRQGKFPRAIAAYQKAIKFSPQFIRVYFNLGQALRDSGKRDKAAAVYKKFYELEPTTARGFRALGYSQYLQRNYAESIRSTKEAIKLNPHSGSAYNNLARALIASGNRKGAIDVWKNATQVDPKHYWVHANLAFSYYREKNYPEAINYAKKALAIDPRKSGPHNTIGHVLKAQKDYRGAMQAYQKAADTSPDNPNNYFRLGNYLRDIGYTTAAIAAYKRAIKLNPKFADAYTNLSAILLDNSDLPGALNALKKATKLDPKPDMAYNNLGVVYIKQKKVPEAIAAYQKAKELNPKFIRAYLNLIAAQKLDKDLIGASKTRKQLMQLDLSAPGYYSLGVRLGDSKDLAGAISVYRKAIALDPNHAGAHCNLGQSLREQGNFADALPYLRRGHQLGSKQANWRYPSDKWVQSCQNLLKLDTKWKAAYEGNVKPTTANAALDLAAFSYRYKKHYRMAVRLYQVAFKLDRKRADDKRYNDRTTAARAAVLAAAGEGKDAANITVTERAALRGQALQWLEDDLTHLTWGGQSGQLFVVKKMAESTLPNRLSDAALDSVRDAAKLAALPIKERQAWQKYWADVKKLQQHVRRQFVDLKLNGTLTSTRPRIVFPMILLGGATYIVELNSRAFDPVLRVEDAKGNMVATNDDIGRGNLNSRIVFRARQDSTYRIIVSSFRRDGKGSYTLRVRKFTPSANQGADGRVAALHYIRGKLTKNDRKDSFVRTAKSYRKVYAIELSAGKTYQVDLTGKFDTYLRVEDSSKRLLHINDDVLPPKDLNSRIVFTPRITDTYRLIVTSFESGATGNFILTIQELVKQGKPFVIQETLKKTDKKYFGSYYKEHKISFVAGQTYIIELKSQQFDTFLILGDPAGKKRLAQNNDATPGNKKISQLTYTPLRTADYVVRATSAGPGEIGAYTLTVQRIGPPQAKTTTKK